MLFCKIKAKKYIVSVIIRLHHVTEQRKQLSKHTKVWDLIQHWTLVLRWFDWTPLPRIPLVSHPHVNSCSYIQYQPSKKLNKKFNNCISSFVIIVNKIFMGVIASFIDKQDLISTGNRGWEENNNKDVFKRETIWKATLWCTDIAAHKQNTMCLNWSCC